LRLFIDSLIIGVSIAAPVGPIGVLCIRRTLAHGRRIGLVSGLGAASADAIYGLIAAFGLTIVTNFLLDDRTSLWLRLIGGAFLVYLGVTTFRTRPPDASKAVPLRSYPHGEPMRLHWR
jgi:threonine/homoserine/homoserine lactone efflux protein